jgi:hypothetical protein
LTNVNLYQPTKYFAEWVGKGAHSIFRMMCCSKKAT